MDRVSRQRLRCCGFVLLLGCGCVLTAGRADAWEGHDVVMRAIVDRLPGELLDKIDNPDALRKAVSLWSSPAGCRPTHGGHPSLFVR